MGQLRRPAPNHPEPATRTIGKLCVGGDWACANGDLEALGDVAVQLADFTLEPLHHELVALSALCRSDPERVSAAWMRLKLQVLLDVAPAPAP
jgi:hypothetical protein